jgi:hypothetical protein
MKANIWFRIGISFSRCPSHCFNAEQNNAYIPCFSAAGFCVNSSLITNNRSGHGTYTGRCSALILLPLLGDFYSYLIDHFGSLLYINTNKLGALDTIYSFFGIHDLILTAIGFFTLTKVRRTDQKLISRSGKFLYIILFLYLLPEFAALFESKRIFFFASQEEWPDGWNTMYVWFRYPMYWTIGILIYLRTQKT